VKVPGVKVKIALSDFAGGYTSLFCEMMVAGFEDDLAENAQEVFQETWMDEIDDIFNDNGERLEKAKRRKLTKQESEAKERAFLEKKAAQEKMETKMLPRVRTRGLLSDPRNSGPYERPTTEGVTHSIEK